MAPDIFVTTLDAARLSRVLKTFHQSFYGPITGFLASELSRAIIVEPKDVPRQVVTMGTRARFKLNRSAEADDGTLVFPGFEEGLLGRISVLSPDGSALIGMREGETMVWNGLDGRKNSLTVLKVVYQPEVNGFDL